MRTEATRHPRIRYRLLLICRQSANGRAGGKTTEGKPKFLAINSGMERAGERERRPTGGCMLARGCTGNLPRNPVLAIRKARLAGRASRPVCAKLRQVLAIGPPSRVRHPPPPAHTQPIVLSLPIFRSPSPLSPLPGLPSLLLSTSTPPPPATSLHSHFPLSARGRCSLSPFIARHSDFN